ncbi:MAG: proline iminopeptidase-family hydrolase [Ktedonobacteraceae bacterium]
MDIPVSEGFITFRGYRTWYRMVGDLDRTPAGKFPVLMLHGGPGIPHDLLKPLAAFSRTGRPVIFYDQIGCGNSDYPEDPSLWHVDLFVEELAVVRQALGLDRMHLFGYCWGGQVAMKYILTRPKGIISLILASSLASMPMCQAEKQRILEELSEEVQSILRNNETSGTIHDPTYDEAKLVFEKRYVCRLESWPDFIQRALERRNWEISSIMWRQSEAHGIFGLKTWDIRSHLGELNVPTLVTSGCYDGLVSGQDEILYRGIPNCIWVRFEKSAHYPHVEENERYLVALDEFLTSIECQSQESFSFE